MPSMTLKRSMSSVFENPENCMRSGFFERMDLSIIALLLFQVFLIVSKMS